MSSPERVSPRGRSQVDNELVSILRAAMEDRGMLQQDLAAASGLTQPQVSVRLSWGGASMPVRQLALLCAALDLDVGETLAEAKRRADDKASRLVHPKARAVGWTASGDDRKQVDAVARQLATSLWNGANSWEFISLAIDQTMDREDRDFWDSRKKELVLMVALAELAYVIGERYPVRDLFILQQVMGPDKIIR